MARAKCGSRGWGYLAARVPDPRACITDCRRRLLHAIVMSSNKTLGEVCQALSDGRRASNAQVYRMVYCCDSQVCGVNNLVRRGKDPNVNWLVDACQYIGHHSVVDPGPPDATYSCKYVPTGERDSPCAIRQAAAETETAGVSSAAGAVAAEGDTPPGMAQSRSFNSSTTATQRPQAAPTLSFITDPSLAAILHSPEPDTESDETSGLSTGVKITIALSTVVGVIVVVTLVLWYLRLRRQSHPRDRVKSRSNKYHNSPAVPGSPTLVVSPTNPHAHPGGLPLTPPLRLRERKFVRTTATADDWPLVDGEGLPWAGYPDSSLRSSMATATETSHPSRGGTKASGDELGSPGQEDVLRPLPAVTTGQYVLESVSSAAHTPTTTTSTASTVVAPAGYGDATATYSPPRTPRQPQTPLHLAGFTSPGPPPNRALPSTPRDEQHSPPATPVRRDGGMRGPNTPSGSRSPAVGVALPGAPNDSGELTGEYARQTYRGGGASGMAGSSQKGAGSPMLAEGELERLGGSYK